MIASFRSAIPLTSSKSRSAAALIALREGRFDFRRADPVQPAGLSAPDLVLRLTPGGRHNQAHDIVQGRGGGASKGWHHGLSDFQSGAHAKSSSRPLAGAAWDRVRPAQAPEPNRSRFSIMISCLAGADRGRTARSAAPPRGSRRMRRAIVGLPRTAPHLAADRGVRRGLVLDSPDRSSVGVQTQAQDGSWVQGLCCS